MSKKLLLLVFCGFCTFSLVAQQTTKPKVVIGIVVDQMRADYLDVFQRHYSQHGFNRLMNKGAWFKNCYINYLPTYTGPGHACIYTGSVPSIHGIVGNNWYSAALDTSRYCVQDDNEKAVGGTLANGYISPRNLKVSTIADELRLATNNKSRTFAMSLKDRGAVLPGGHTANSAYWMDGSLGHFMTSSFYTKNLPVWVQSFNKDSLAQYYLDKGWNTLYAKSSYLYAANDSNDYEGKFGAEERNHFPYSFDSLSPDYIKKTPYGNSILFDFAKEAIRAEKIGHQNVTDFLAISFSATDYIGHVFGPNSLEVEDTYARFDAELATFLDFLDKEYGSANYMIFMTADHGAAHNPNYLRDKKVPADYFYSSKELLDLNEHLEQLTGIKDLCVKLMNSQVYIDKRKQKQLENISHAEIVNLIVSYFNQHELVQTAFDPKELYKQQMAPELKQFYANSYNGKRSGDVAILLDPAVLDAYSETGTSHGAWSAYDAKIPLLFYGTGVQNLEINEQVYMTDIAPTIANLLGIMPPNGNIGKAILPRD